MSDKLTAALLIVAAVLTNAAFTVLGTVFNYPDILGEPVEDILAAFRAHRTAVVGWFAAMALILGHRVLGTLVGETLGYTLTAAWTLLVLIAVGGWIARRWFTALGAVSAVLILGGDSVPCPGSWLRRWAWVWVCSSAQRSSGSIRRLPMSL
jgi:hypothetical protein